MQKVKLHKNNIFMFYKNESIPTNLQQSLDETILNSPDNLVEEFEQLEKQK